MSDSDMLRRGDVLKAIHDALVVNPARDEARKLAGFVVSALPAVQPDALIAERDEALECNEQFFVDNQILRERVAKAEAEREQLKAKIRFLERRALD